MIPISKTPIPFYLIILLVFTAHWVGCQQEPSSSPVVIDETDQLEAVESTILIDSVWSGHPVGFCLLTRGEQQYIAYYNANRNMVVGQRHLADNKFNLHIMEATSRDTHGGTSTVLGWDSHNYITMEIDKEGFLHLSGNVHAHPLTYFRSTVPGDITTLEQVTAMTGEQEDRTTYPKFMKTMDGELVYTYRDGGSGNGNQVFNIYQCETKTWSRLLDTPLTDGQGQMNAYISIPTLGEDNWYHSYWVWRDTPDCSTNHDLSYMKSPDLNQWYNAFGEPIALPVTAEKKLTIVDPIPPRGGIINLAAKMVLDDHKNPVFVYHKYDSSGNLQFYTARIHQSKWEYQQITDWDYRWEFQGRGSINSEVVLRGFKKRPDDNYQVDYWHIKYGEGSILLDNNFSAIGEVLRPVSFQAQLQPEGKFPGLKIRTSSDIGDPQRDNTRFLLKWETLDRNRDRPREGALPPPSNLYLHKLQPKSPVAQSTLIN